MENKILDFWFGPVFCGPTKLAQITALEATKIEAEIQYDRWSTPECEKCEIYQPVKNVCSVTKFRQLMHFI